MINGYHPYDAVTRHHEELLAAAAHDRLLAAYRRAHPELSLRSRLAGRLRSLADRLAQESSPPNHSAVRAGSPSAGAS